MQTQLYMYVKYITSRTTFTCNTSQYTATQKNAVNPPHHLTEVDCFYKRGDQILVQYVAKMEQQSESKHVIYINKFYCL